MFYIEYLKCAYEYNCLVVLDVRQQKEVWLSSSKLVSSDYSDDAKYEAFT